MRGLETVARVGVVVLTGLVRIGAVVLLGTSAWYGFVAGARRWAPCADYFDSAECLVAQAHETESLPELAHPEGTSLLLLGGALLCLALLRRLPRGWLVAALGVGLLYAWVGLDVWRSAGRTEVDPGPPYHPSLLDGIFALGAFAAPWVMVGVGGFLLVRSIRAPGPGWLHPERPLALAWFAMALGWPITEFSVLSLFYASYDAPPGTGMLRAAMTAVAAVLVVWHLVNLQLSRAGAHAASVTSPEASVTATSEA